MDNALVNYLEVKDIYELPFLQEATKGQICKITSTNEFYQFTDKGWNPIQPNADLQMQLYEMNRQIISQLPPLTEEIVLEKIKMINQFKVNTKNNYFMLYGKEVSYFSLMRGTPKSKYDETLGQATFACLENFGSVHSCELTEDKSAVEIWAKYGEMLTCLYLFPYDSGIVEYKV